MQSIIGRHRAHDFQLSGVQDFDVGSGRAAGNQSAGGAYGDRFSGRSQAKAYGDCFRVGRGNVGGLDRKARSQYAHRGRTQQSVPRNTATPSARSSLNGGWSRGIGAEQFHLRPRNRRRLGIDNLDLEIGSRRRCQQE